MHNERCTSGSEGGPKKPGGRKADRALRSDPIVALMTESAERCDLGVGGAGFIFPPLRRTIRPLAPEAAAKRWLARFRELAGSSPADSGSVHAGSSAADTAPASVAAEASS